MIFLNPFSINVAPLTAKLNLFTRLVHFSMLTCILFIQHSVFYFCSNIFHYILAQVCNICYAIFLQRSREAASPEEFQTRVVIVGCSLWDHKCLFLNE